MSSTGIAGSKHRILSGDVKQSSSSSTPQPEGDQRTEHVLKKMKSTPCDPNTFKPRFFQKVKINEEQFEELANEAQNNSDLYKNTAIDMISSFFERELNSGFTSLEEVVENLDYIVFDVPEPLKTELNNICMNTKELKKILYNCVEKCLNEQKSAEGASDFDRLNEVFKDLGKRGIFCKHDIQTTPSSCYMRMEEDWVQLKDAYNASSKENAATDIEFNPHKVWGFVYYNFQDTARAASTHQLYLNFISLADGEQEQKELLELKQLIFNISTQHGLKVLNKNDPSPETRVKLNFTAQTRFDPQLLNSDFFKDEE